MVSTVPVSSVAEWDHALMVHAEDRLNTALGYLHRSRYASQSRNRQGLSHWRGRRSLLPGLPKTHVGPFGRELARPHC